MKQRKKSFTFPCVCVIRQAGYHREDNDSFLKIKEYAFRQASSGSAWQENSHVRINKRLKSMEHPRNLKLFIL